MSVWVCVFYFSVVSAALVLSLLGLWFTAIMPGMDRWNKRFFLSYFAVLMLCCLSATAEMALYFFSVPRWAIFFASILDSLCLSLPLPMLTVYLLHCCGENIRKSGLLRAALCLWAVYVVLLASTPFADWFTYLASDKEFYRGRLYPLLLTPMIAVLLLNLAGTIRRRKQLSRKVFLSFVVALLPMTAAVAINMFFDAIPIFDISFILSAVAMFGMILSDQVEQDLRRQREIAQQRAGVMVLQMRPHFICNTMITIYHLCKQDPDKAQQVTLDFTNYLRQNFTAIASEHTVPFADELRHTHAYLAVEQAMHEDSLFVEMDTPHTFFRVPPLTLQPLVENAVKHGMDPDSKPLHIFVGTRQTDDGSEITVENDGPDFVPADDNEPHIALNNIRQRIEMMCKGTLTITPRSGGGTVVTITIPQKQPKQ